jgi:hypothetical protein
MIIINFDKLDKEIFLLKAIIVFLQASLVSSHTQQYGKLCFVRVGIHLCGAEAFNRRWSLFCGLSDNRPQTVIHGANGIQPECPDMSACVCREQKLIQGHVSSRLLIMWRCLNEWRAHGTDWQGS